MKDERWRTGDLAAIAAAVTLVVSMAYPWVQGGTGRAVRATLPEIGFLVAVSAVLAALGLMRSSATGLVALLASFAIAFVLFASAIPAHTFGTRPGFGLFALGGSAALALLAGVLNAIEREGGTF